MITLEDLEGMSKAELKTRLLNEQKEEGEISKETMESLEDFYHIDLTHLYGEGDDPKAVDKILRKLR